MKRGGAEGGWGRGRRVRCSIGHYLRRVTGSVVTAPRFAHWLPVLHRSPTPLSLSLASLHLAPSSFASSLSGSRCFSSLIRFVHSSLPHCPPLRRIPATKASARFSRRPQEVRPWIGSAARCAENIRLFFARFRSGRGYVSRGCLSLVFSRGIQR